jgi:hypothetical protein
MIKPDQLKDKENPSFDKSITIILPKGEWGQ